MKKIVIGMFVLAALCISSCDDKLEIVPKGQVILSKESEYSALLDAPLTLLYDPALAWNTCFDAGMVSSLVTGDGYLFIKTNYLGLTNYNRIVDFKTDQLYTKCYERISRYNIIIDNVMDSEGIETDKQRTRAEALVLRAYNHFILVNTFCKHYNKSTANNDGGIVLCTRFSLEDKPIQRSVEDVYKSIENDLNLALPNLKARGKNVNHPGLAFAYGLLAKVYLFKQEFDKAEIAAKESLKNHSYIFDWVAWDTGTKPAPEIGYNNEENLYFGYGINNFPPTGSCIGPHLVKKYTPGDLRKDRFFWFTFSAILPGCYTFRGYMERVNGVNVSRNIKLNIGGMKVSEVVLMLAECYARSGKINESMQLVNDLRKKRILPENYADLSAATKEEAFNIVMDERSRELFITPNNFYDVRRLEAEGIHQSVERTLADGSKVTVNSNSHVFVMPFPENAIIRNNSLKQNVDK